MPDDLTIAMATAVVTAALSIVTTYYATREKIRHDLLAQYDKDLRERRLTAYGTLWTLTEPLARYSPREPLTAQGARGLSEGLREWYFRQGLVMSKAAREAYFALQRKLIEIRAPAAAAEPLNKKTLKRLQRASSDLHTALCGDVGSRKPPMIGSKAEADRSGARGWKGMAQSFGHRLGLRRSGSRRS